MSDNGLGSRGWRLTGGDLGAWVEGLLRAGHRVIAPVEEGGPRRFRAVESADPVCLAPGKTRWSPKEFLFPRTETLFAYAVQGDRVQVDDAPTDDTEQVLLGVRPCDAAGLARLDAVLAGPEGDPRYTRRRERTAVVSLACPEAAPECFCSAVGGGPAEREGSDLQLIAAGEAWLLVALTPKGLALAAPFGDRVPAASPEDWAVARAGVERVEAGLRQSPVAREWAAALEAAFGHPLWEALGRRCLGCSVCTYVCPSCSCFDVQDAGTAVCGERCRSWDSCTFDLFTRHASGHNPRDTQAARYRQRVLHKFAYFPLAHEGRFMCVGCGRCVALCPVGMSIRDSVSRVVAASGEGSHGRS